MQVHVVFLVDEHIQALEFLPETEVRLGEPVELWHGEILVDDAATDRPALPGQHCRRGSHPDPGLPIRTVVPHGNGIDLERHLIRGTGDRKSGLRSARELEGGGVGDAVKLFLEVVVGTAADDVHPAFVLVMQHGKVLSLKGLPVAAPIVVQGERDAPFLIRSDKGEVVGHIHERGGRGLLRRAVAAAARSEREEQKSCKDCAYHDSFYYFATSGFGAARYSSSRIFPFLLSSMWRISEAMLYTM